MKESDKKELWDALNKFYNSLPYKSDPPELHPELNPKNWSEEYKAFRAKYPDDYHKRIFRSSDRSVITHPDKAGEK